MKHLAYPLNDKPAQVIELIDANKVSCLTMPLDDKRTLAIGYMDGRIDFLDLQTGSFSPIQEKIEKVLKKQSKE